jgi:hypothetical protein
VHVGTNRPQGNCYGVDNMSGSVMAEGLRNDTIARASNKLQQVCLDQLSLAMRHDGGG